MCQNFCDTYCAAMHRAITKEEAKGKPCEADGQDSRFEALLSEYQLEAIETAFLKQQEPEPDPLVEIAKQVGKIRERFSFHATENPK